MISVMIFDSGLLVWIHTHCSHKIVQVNVVCQFYNSYGFLVSIAQHGSGILYKLKSEKVQSTKMKEHYAQGEKIA